MLLQLQNRAKPSSFRIDQEIEDQELGKEEIRSSVVVVFGATSPSLVVFVAASSWSCLSLIVLSVARCLFSHSSQHCCSPGRFVRRLGDVVVALFVTRRSAGVLVIALILAHCLARR